MWSTDLFPQSLDGNRTTALVSFVYVFCIRTKHQMDHHNKHKRRMIIYCISCNTSFVVEEITHIWTCPMCKVSYLWSDMMRLEMVTG